MKRTMFIVIIIIVSATSCKKQTQKNDMANNLIKLSIPNIGKANISQYHIEQIYSKISGFELDRTGGDIGLVSKILIHKNFLFVLDSKYAKKLFVYDLEKNGRFLFKLGKVGKGPGEFLRISDFAIDSLGNQILVADMQQRKISYFGIDGSFENEIKVNFTPLNIYCHNEYLYFLCNPQKANDMVVKITDKNFKTVKEYLPNHQYPLTIKNATGFFKVDNKVLLNYSNCDTIYQLKNLNMKPYVVFETGDYSFYSFIKRNNISSKEVLSYIMPGSQRNEDFKDIIIPQLYFEDNKLRLFSFLWNDRFRFILQLKNLSDSNPTLGYLHDNIMGFPINLKVNDIEYGTINIVDPSQVVKVDLNLIKTNCTNVTISSQLIQEIRNADMNCNPFIIFYK